MSHLLPLFAENLFPILATASVGFLLQRIFRIDPKPLSVVIFYALTPALVFDLLVRSQIDGNGILRMTTAASVLILTLAALAWGVTKLFRLPPPRAAGMMMTIAFMNAGNYGLSLNRFALGEAGLAWASIFFISSSLFTNSLGVFIASAGKYPIREALLRLLRVPAIYAIPAAILVRIIDLRLPLALSRPIDLMSDATIPLMLIVLGMQVSKTGIPEARGLLAAVSGMRLILAPAIFALFALLFKLPPLASQVGTIEAAMPSAVLTTIIAMEFDAWPEFVTGAVLTTTLLSPITLTPLLALLGL